MTMRNLRGAAAIAIGALALATGAPAGADQGSAVIDSKAEGQVVLSGVEFRVSESTVIESKDGNRVPFAELPTTAEGASGDDAAVWYEASDADASPTLHLLKLTGAMPR